MNNQMSLIDWALILGIGSIWGASFLFVRIAVPEMGPLNVVASRMIIGALFLAPFFLRIKHLRKIKEHFPVILFFSLFYAVFPFLLFANSALVLSAGTLSILNSTTPLFALVISIVWLKTKFSFLQLAGLLLGIFGILTIIGFESITFSIWPFVFCLVAAFFYALSSTFIYKLEDIDPSYLATISLLIGFFIAFPFTFIDGGIDLDQEFRVLLSIFLLGTLCTGLGYIGHMFLIKRIGPVRATTSLFIVPISGMFLGNMFLSESITLFMILGCILILIGVAMTLSLIHI